MTFRTLIAAVRGHHWFKNVLVFLPIALAHRLGPASFFRTLAGFVLFGMSASAIYVLNDLLDLHSDREHPWKQKRPFAAGDISIPGGFLISFVLLAVALPCAFILSHGFFAVLVGYIVLTMWYSLRLKSIVLLDAMVLSAFYSIRIWAGALLTATPLSHWFLSFSLFFFMSLAMAKRYSELLGAKDLVESGRSGRGYRGTDSAVLMNLGVASGFSAIVIFSLYVNSTDVTVLYRRPEVLLLLAPLLAYWLSRVWLQAHRGELHDDPITLALRDGCSYAVAAAAAVILAISSVKLG
jgi:4-hydroxybenzoate polyprenyltransferase